LEFSIIFLGLASVTGTFMLLRVFFLLDTI
jgi:hypothetical protein